MEDDILILIGTELALRGNRIPLRFREVAKEWDLLDEMRLHVSSLP